VNDDSNRDPETTADGEQQMPTPSDAEQQVPAPAAADQQLPAPTAAAADQQMPAPTAPEHDQQVPPSGDQQHVSSPNPFWVPLAGTAHWHGEPATPPHRRRAGLRSTAVAAAVVLAVGAAGVGIGHAVWPPAASGAAQTALGQTTDPNSPSTGTIPVPNGAAGALPLDPFGGTLPDGSAGNGSAGNGSAGDGSAGTAPSGSGSTNPGSTAAGAPSNAAAIAKIVDAGVVDINTEIGYGAGQAAGTGMVLTPNGEILTNNHVISGATKISVTDVANGKTYAAIVVGYDRTHDIAVLQLTGASGLTTVNIAKTPASTGAGVVAVGNAGGLGGTPSYAAGVVTATNQQITASDASNGTSETLTGLIETNANVQSGDSGGPLVNVKGEVVGIDTAAGAAYRFSNVNNGFAIPIAQAMQIASTIEAGQASATVHIGTTAMLGVQVASGQTYGAASGAAVAGVLSGGPAAKAGLTAGSVITVIGGHAVSSPDALTTALLAHKPGDKVSVRYVDQTGASHTVTVQLAAGPPQ
jgi:S1-C subfamily serine protease